MHPEFLGLIKSYGLMLAISFSLGLWLSIRLGRTRGLDPDTVMDLVFGVLVSSIIGVRLFFVMTHLGDFHPWYRAFFIWDGGLTLYGGILLAMAAVWYLCRRRRVPFMVVADIFSPGVALGIGLTRIGCFMAGCCYGKPTGCACGVHFPANAPAVEQFGPVAVFPSQLVGSGGGFLIAAILLLVLRRRPRPGTVFALFMILYGVQRFAIDFTRYYTPDQMIAGLTNNQWISVGLLVSGSLLLLSTRKSEASTHGD